MDADALQHRRAMRRRDIRHIHEKPYYATYTAWQGQLQHIVQPDPDDDAISTRRWKWLVNEYKKQLKTAAGQALLLMIGV